MCGGCPRSDPRKTFGIGIQDKEPGCKPPRRRYTLDALKCCKEQEKPSFPCGVFVVSQTLLGLPMEDPDPPLDTPEGFWGLKTWLEGPKQIELERLSSCNIWQGHP